MDKLHPAGVGSQPRPRRMVLSFGVTLLLLTLAGYCMIAFEYSTGTFNVHKNALFGVINGHSASSNTTEKAPEADVTSDRFALHPLQHILRKPKTLKFDWNITKGKHSPDGVLKDVYLINGLFPGPTIEARSGDELEIHVTNNIKDDDHDGISVHWHGLSLKGANHMDGAVGITQCAIGQTNTFTYKFKIQDDEHGTFWYHAHSAVKRADGLFGGLVVHKPAEPNQKEGDLTKYKYDAERLFLIGDWHHLQAKDVLEWYKDPRHFGLEPAPESLLINGEGSFNCSNANDVQNVQCTAKPVPSFQVRSQKSVRLRVINTGASAGYSLQIGQGSMRVITVDGGGSVQNAPAASAVGVLYPGERMDVLLESAEAGNMDTNLTVILDQEIMPLMNPALTPTQHFPLHWERTDKTTRAFESVTAREEIVKQFDLQDAQGEAVDAKSSVHKKPPHAALFYSTIDIRATQHNEPVGNVNRTSWILADAAAKPLLALDRTQWDGVTKQPSSRQKFHVPFFPEGEWIDIVVNNGDDKGHPFHIHGFDFYVVSTAISELGQWYNPFDPDNKDYQAQKFSTQTALRKDTVHVPSRGHVILRFKMDNVGLWLMHCHVLWHQAIGMGIVLQVGNATQATMDKASASCTKS